MIEYKRGANTAYPLSIVVGKNVTCKNPTGNSTRLNHRNTQKEAPNILRDKEIHPLVNQIVLHDTIADCRKSGDHIVAAKKLQIEKGYSRREFGAVE